MIKNVIFDFGGVLLHLEEDRTRQALTDLLHLSKPEDYLVLLKNHMESYEMGLMSDEAFIWKFQNLAPKPISPIEIIDAWNAMLVTIRPNIIPFLIKTKNQYHTFILSNTNAIHIKYVMQQILAKSLQLTNWDEYFDNVFYSHQLHMRKPNENIYREVIKLAGINPRETLFIDDNAANIETAKACGWNAIWHPSNEPIEENLPKYISIIENN